MHMRMYFLCNLSLPVVFKQGEEGVFWYIVYSGSVDVRVSSSGDLAQVS